MTVITFRISGIDVGGGVSTASGVMDVMSSALEQDVCEIFIETLHGKQNVFDKIVENDDVSNDVVLTLIATDSASVTVHVSQPNRDSDSFTSLCFSIFNATFRTCIVPYASKQKELVISFPDVDICSLEGVIGCKEKNRVSPNRCDYNLKWFLSDALKKDFMNDQINTGLHPHRYGELSDIIFGEEESSDEEFLKISENEASGSEEMLKGLILNKTDADMIKRLFQGKLRSGKREYTMISCLNPNHNDSNPSMRVTVSPFSWQWSKKIVVDEKTNKELMDLYHNDEGVGTKFTYISDNAVRDTRTGRIYILYAVRKHCFSCSFRC